MAEHNKIYSSLADLTGGTPLFKLSRLAEKLHLHASILAKLEYFNPAGSIKDRVALAMLNQAAVSGLLKPGGTIIEPTSGNTGIALAALGAAFGYHVIIVMPENMSGERRKLIRAYGAQLECTPAGEGMKGAMKRADELQKQIPGSIIAGQFSNPANPMAHFNSTGPEIYEATQGKIDIFVAGVGTGGTLSGTGEYLKQRIPDLEIVAVEPADSPVLSGGKAGPHKIQGIGAGFVPELLNRGLIDKIMTATTGDAYNAAHQLAQTEGLLTGISSGACLWVAITLASAEENAGKTIVAILPDSSDRYFSTDLFA